MIYELRDKYDLNLKHCWPVVDRWKKFDTDDAADCRAIFLDDEYDEPLRTPQ